MNQTINEEEAIKQYLLGRLSEEEQTPLEERLLTDDDFFERLNLAEDELIDEYLAAGLRADEGERFLSHFLVAPERQQKLTFSMALTKYVRLVPGDSATNAFPKASKDDALGIGTRDAVIAPQHRVIPGPWTRIVSTPYFRMAASILILAGIGLGIYRGFFYQSGVDKGLAALRDAYRSRRPIEARISALSYAPFTQMRGGEQPTINQLKHDRAQRILLDELDDHPSANSEHAIGEFYLADRQLEKAILHLSAAVSGTPADPRYHNDIGAALLEKGKADQMAADSDRMPEARGKAFEELAQGLEHFNKALDLDPALLEALFNRALCYQEMALLHQARDDLEAYLQRDGNSRWAEEVRARIKILDQPGNSTSRIDQPRAFQEFVNGQAAGDDSVAWRSLNGARSPTGNLITERLLDDYLGSLRDGRHSKAERDLDLIRYAGGLEANRAGDLFTRDLAKFYSEMSLGRLTCLLTAHELKKSAFRLYSESKLEQALENYGRAKALFDKVGDEWDSLSVRFWIGHCYFQKPDTARSHLTFVRLVDDCHRGNYRWMLSLSLIGLANVEVRLNEYSKAIAAIDRSLAISEDIGDLMGMLRGLSRAAEAYESVGKYYESLGSARRGLDIASILGGATQIVGVYAVTGRTLGRLGIPSAALPFVCEALRVGRESHNPLVISHYCAQVGLAYGRLGSYGDAISYLDEAYREGERLRAETIGREMMGYALLNLGQIYKDMGEFARATAAYSQSIEVYYGSNDPAFLYRAYKGRLLCYIAQHRDNSVVEQEIGTVMRFFEGFRSTILEESDRESFFDGEQSIYDEAIDFECSRAGNAHRAFEYSEMSRGRDLLSLIEKASWQPGSAASEQRLGNSSGPISSAELVERLPAQNQILQYGALKNKLLMWVVSKDGISTVIKEISLDELSARITNYGKSISAGMEGQRNTQVSAKELYRILIAPVEHLLDKKKRLCIVPDKVLNYLPYSTLVSETGRYLLEDYELVFSPSSSTFIISSEAAQNRAGMFPERLLSVGNPRFDALTFPLLSDLPAAGREAKAIAPYYSFASILTDDKATLERVKEGMRRSDVIHLAVHCVRDEFSPMRSKLVLAGTCGRSGAEPDPCGILEAKDVYRMSLAPRLVVLSACQSGVERYYGGEGPVGFSRSFIAAGAPLVVASLWKIDSEAAAALMVDFHRYRTLQHLSSTAALRKAQLDAIADPIGSYREPRNWGAFIAIGGSASF